MGGWGVNTGGHSPEREKHSYRGSKKVHRSCARRLGESGCKGVVPSHETARLRAGESKVVAVTGGQSCWCRSVKWEGKAMGSQPLQTGTQESAQPRKNGATGVARGMHCHRKAALRGGRQQSSAQPEGSRAARGTRGCTAARERGCGGDKRLRSHRTATGADPGPEGVQPPGGQRGRGRA